VLTAENLIKKNWPCDYLCSLCLCLHETTEHFLSQCNYSEVVWNHLTLWFGLQGYSQMIAEGGPTEWYMMQMKTKPEKERQKRVRIVFTF
jgi:hypothetical protein